MVNKNAKKVYCVLGKSHESSPFAPEDIFIGLFKDERYHILGCRPTGLEYLLPDDRQSNDDWGVIKLPDGISRLEDMKRDMTFTTYSNTTAISFISRFLNIKKIL